MSWADARGGSRSEPSSYYQTAQVCLNGHVITPSVESSPAKMSKFCSSCGEQTTTTCPSCNQPIRGEYVVPGVLTIGRRYVPPSFCPDCGKPLPWTERALASANELADQIDELDADEKSTLKKAIVQLTTDTPRTELASIQYKKLVGKAGAVIGRAMNSILVSVATEAAKKMIGL